MRTARALAAGILLATALLPAAAAQGQDTHRDETPKLDAGIAREITYDICFPATAEEYAALGKNAILMLQASSGDAAELPLASVYIMHGNARMTLRRIMQLDTVADQTTGRTVQHSFYLLPIHDMKRDGALAADFTGERKAFRLADFAAKTGLGPYAPAFARLDDQDTPADPDEAVLMRVLAREYPHHFE